LFQLAYAVLIAVSTVLTGGGFRLGESVVPAALAGPAAAPDNSLTLQPLVTSGLAKPLLVTNAGDGSNRLFIVEQGGLIKVFSNGQVLGTPFLDLTSAIVTSSEQGLLGLAFHPNYRTNGRFFVFYTAKVTSSTIGVGDNVLAEYRASPPGANQAVVTPTRVLFSLSDPYTNHNGGNLGFGPDGYLYVGTGDGGGTGDPENRAQNLQSLFGKMLRLDVDNIPTGKTYGIPPTNPFVGQSGKLPEVWALGLRNPWRWSFDRGASATDPNRGALFVGDVGQSAWEEVDRAAPGVGGQNYGWRLREGAHCFNPATGCPTAGLVDPILEYDHSLGCAVIGGFVYRGAALPSLQGTYLYADECSGRVWKARPQGAGWTSSEALDTTLSLSSFGEDESGELYVVDLNGGLYRVGVAATVGGKGLGISNSAVPQGNVVDLSWTGGDTQAAYLLLRLDVTGAQVGTTGTAVAASATAFQDSGMPGAPTLNCYTLFPLNGALGVPGTVTLGRSDELCAQQPTSVAPYPPPTHFTLRLNQSSTASLSWTNAPGTYGLILVALPLNGSPTRYLPLGFTVTTATDQTGGAATCYILVAGTNAGTTSTGGLVCGVPGASSFPVAAAQPGTAQARPSATSRQGVGSTEQARTAAEQRFERQITPNQARLAHLQRTVLEAQQTASERLTGAPHR
jgi:glucose/arabinose dehydrogenase